jgi:hypothetical protein
MIKIGAEERAARPWLAMVDSLHKCRAQKAFN